MPLVPRRYAAKLSLILEITCIRRVPKKALGAAYQYLLQSVVYAVGLMVGRLRPPAPNFAKPALNQAPRM